MLHETRPHRTDGSDPQELTRDLGAEGGKGPRAGQAVTAPMPRRDLPSRMRTTRRLSLAS